jgi:hypothetical protein
MNAKTFSHDMSHAKGVLDEIEAERKRQISKEGWSIEHDDDHGDGSLADAAACYAATTRPFKAEEFAGVGYRPYTTYSDLWPKSWADHYFKPRKSRRRRLIIAAALLVAEIERLDRAEPHINGRRVSEAG